MILEPNLLDRLKDPKALAGRTIYDQWLVYISDHREVGITPWRDNACDMSLVASIPYDIDATALAEWFTHPNTEKQMERLWQASQLSQGHENHLNLRRVLESMLSDVARLTMVETDQVVLRAQDLFHDTQTSTLDGLVHEALNRCVGPREFNPVSGFPHGTGLVDLGMALAAALVDRIAAGKHVSPSLWKEGLFNALRNNNLKAVERVLDWGVKVNAKDQTKATPLNLARSKEAVWMLLDHGAKQTGQTVPLAEHTVEWIMEWNREKDLEALKKAVLTSENKTSIKRKL